MLPSGSHHQTLTSTALLDGLFTSDNAEVWQEFDRRFRPILLNVGRRMGLDPEDAADIAQETLLQFIQDYRAGKYDRSKGRLRFWVQGIARHRVHDLRRKRDELRGARGDSVLGSLPVEGDLERVWDEECRRKILEDALELLTRQSDLKPATVEAFRRYALAGEEPQKVAEDLGLTLRAVYMAKHHGAQHLKQIMEQLTDAYEVL